MHLKDYLREADLSPEAFGESIGKTGMAVRRYCSGTRMPRPDVADDIVAKTGGRVTLDDLHKCYLAVGRST